MTSIDDTVEKRGFFSRFFQDLKDDLRIGWKGEADVRVDESDYFKIVLAAEQFGLTVRRSKYGGIGRIINGDGIRAEYHPLIANPKEWYVSIKARTQEQADELDRVISEAISSSGNYGV